jgi:hypothetical protein
MRRKNSITGLKQWFCDRGCCTTWRQLFVIPAAGPVRLIEQDGQRRLDAALDGESDAGHRGAQLCEQRLLHPRSGVNRKCAGQGADHVERWRQTTDLGGGN